MKAKRNNKGFTLVEMIVVVAVIAIVSIVIAPKMIEYVEKARVGTDENALMEVAHAAEVAYVAYGDGKTAEENVFQVRIGGTGSVSYAPINEYVEAVRETISKDAYTYKSEAYRNSTYSISVDEVTGKAKIIPGEHTSISSYLDSKKILGTTYKSIANSIIKGITKIEMTEDDWEKVDEIIFEGTTNSQQIVNAAIRRDKEYFEWLVQQIQE